MEQKDLRLKVTADIGKGFILQRTGSFTFQIVAVFPESLHPLLGTFVVRKGDNFIFATIEKNGLMKTHKLVKMAIEDVTNQPLPDPVYSQKDAGLPEAFFGDKQEKPLVKMPKR